MSININKECTMRAHNTVLLRRPISHSVVRVPTRHKATRAKAAPVEQTKICPFAKCRQQWQTMYNAHLKPLYEKHLKPFKVSLGKTLEPPVIEDIPSIIKKHKEQIGILSQLDENDPALMYRLSVHSYVSLVKKSIDHDGSAGTAISASVFPILISGIALNFLGSSSLLISVPVLSGLFVCSGYHVLNRKYAREQAGILAKSVLLQEQALGTRVDQDNSILQYSFPQIYNMHPSEIPRHTKVDKV